MGFITVIGKEMCDLTSNFYMFALKLKKKNNFHPLIWVAVARGDNLERNLARRVLRLPPILSKIVENYFLCKNSKYFGTPTAYNEPT